MSKAEKVSSYDIYNAGVPVLELYKGRDCLIMFCNKSVILYKLILVLFLIFISDFIM